MAKEKVEFDRDQVGLQNHFYSSPPKVHVVWMAEGI